MQISNCKCEMATKRSKSTNVMQSLFGSGHLMAKQYGGHVTIIYTDEKKNSIIYTNSDASWDQLSREGLKLQTVEPGSWNKRVDVVMDSKNKCVLKLREDSAVSTIQPSGNEAANGNTNISHVSGSATNSPDYSGSININSTGKQSIGATNMPEVSDCSISTVVFMKEVHSSPVPVERSLNLSGESEHEAGDHQRSESPDIEEMNDKDNSGPLPSGTSQQNPRIESSEDVEMMLDNTCPVCKLAFDNREAFIDHTIYEEKIKRGIKYQLRVCGSCTMCQKSFNDHCDDLWPKKRFACCQCKSRCFTNVGLKQHTNMHIGENKCRYLCSVCGKSFFNIKQFKAHNSHHIGKKSVTCTICGKVLQPSSLKVHMSCHTGVKYPCKLCDRVYNTQNAHDRHHLKHKGKSELKRFECILCDKRFSDSLKLKYHMNVHTGDKPYKCPICDKGFTQEGYVQKHLRLVHKQDPPKKQ